MSALVDHRGATILLQYGQGEIEADKFGHPLDICGNAILGSFTLGLGGDFRPNWEVRSGAASDGRSYDVWIFHHENLGQRILAGVLNTLAGKAVTQEAALTSTADEDRHTSGRSGRGRATMPLTDRHHGRVRMEAESGRIEVLNEVGIMPSETVFSTQF